MNIIVVEDEIRSREGLVNLIEKLSHSYKIIGIAENGYDGLHMIKKMNPDLVITDIKMPVMDGIDMIKQIRENHITAQIIILTAFADFSYAQQAISFGVTEYLLKPICVNNLLDLLKKIENDIGEKDVVLAKKNQVSPLIERACSIMGSPKGLNLSLSEISAQLKITPEYLGTQFNKELGCHFSIYIKRKRLEYAKCLLKNTNIKISDIATKVGYNDAKYFSQIFKKEMGLLPIEYRRQ